MPQSPSWSAVAGAYRSEARASIEALADRLGAVVATTLKTKDLFQGYPYQVGIVDSFSHAPARRLIAQADCIVAFGAGLNQRTTSYGTALPADVPLIQIDTSTATMGRTFHADSATSSSPHSTAGMSRH